jgi:hypothetical protein
MDASTNAGAVADSIREYKDEFGDKVGEAQRRLGNKFMDKMQNKSPVDTGRFRRSWNIAWGSPDESTESPREEGTFPPLSESEMDPGPRPAGERDLYVSNYLVYGPPLNNGHSDQAPSGFFELGLHELVEQFRGL